METTEPIKTINTVYTAKTDSTEASNLFTIDALPVGTYYVSISSDYALTRNDIIITMGNENIDNVVIPIIACNYDQDEFITLADAGHIYANMSTKELSYDLDGDGYVTLADASNIYSLMGTKYDGFEIK